jgi:hypothetical protein
MLDQLGRRRDAFLEHAIDRELAAVFELRGRAESGDSEAGLRLEALKAKLKRRAEMQGPQPRSPRKRRTRYQLLRFGHVVIRTAIPHDPKDARTATSGDIALVNADLAAGAAAPLPVRDLPALDARPQPVPSRRQARPAAVESWINGGDRSNEPLSPRAWVSQASRRNWAVSKGVADMEF